MFVNTIYTNQNVKVPFLLLRFAMNLIIIQVSQHWVIKVKALATPQFGVQVCT